MPTKRTFEKFVRDWSVAVIVFGLTWILDNIADLGLDPVSVAIMSQVVPLALGSFRTGRGAKSIPWGTEPMIGT